jgi:hypothetical protein
MNFANPNSPVVLSKSSGNYSARCEMLQGDPTDVTGPQVVWRERVEKYGPSGEPVVEHVPTPQTYTVRFWVVPPSTGAGGSPLATTYECLAFVESIVAGVPIERMITVGYGAAITLTGEQVNVRLRDQTAAAFIPTGVNEYPYSPLEGANLGAQKYNVLVQITPGERPNYLLPPFLKGVADLVGGVEQSPGLSGTIDLASSESARYPIPQKAGVLGVDVVAVNDADPSAACNVVVSAQAAAVVAKQWNPQIDTGLRLLPANATYVVVTNVSGATANVTLNWIIEG